MNKDNLEKLIAHVEGLTESRTSWLPCQCFQGMLHAMNAGFGHGNSSIAEYLEIRHSTAEDLAYRRGIYDMHDIAQLDLDEQKRVMVGALTSLRDIGEVVWEK